MKRIYLFILLSFYCFSIEAQVRFKALPKSFSQSINYELVEEFVGEPIDVESLFAEDELSDSPWMRSGITKPIDKSINELGEWRNLEEGGRIWLMRFKAPNAVATSLYLKNISLPTGAYFNIYSPNKENLRGAFDSRSYHNRGLFTHDDLPGEELIMELYEPANAIGQSYFEVNSLCYMYVMPQHLLKTSGACNVDVNCAEGSAWEDQKKAVVRIKTYKGGWVGWCSGTLLNNTNEDCRPLILTAWHCGLGNGFSDPTQNDLDNYLFYFNYERAGCGTGTVLNEQVLGCNMLGNSQDGGGDHGSDFMLVELNMPIPWDYHVYYAGWDAEDLPSSGGVSIHHPSGDYKKISTFNFLTFTDQYGTATGSHWRVTWSSTANGHGVTEGGSSGGALFNSDGLVMGQLTGGSASCSSPSSPDLFGKMSYNWNSNIGVGGDALQPLLDPANTGALSLSGTYPPCLANLTENESGFENVEIFPNPSIGEVYIQTPDFDNYTLTVLSVTGKKVYSVQVLKENQKRIDLSSFSSGIYFLQIVNQFGQFSKKIVLK